MIDSLLKRQIFTLLGVILFSGVAHAQLTFCEDIIGFDCSSCPDYSVTPNPDLLVSCENSINMILLIDESNSIWISGVQEEVADGVNAFLGELECSSVNIAIIEFGSVANYIVESYTPVSDVIQGMEGYFNNMAFNGQIYAPNLGGLGATNWQASLLQTNLLPTADLVLMLTDGVPTAYTPDATMPESSFDFCGSGNSTQQAEIYNSVQLANTIKQAGSHMFVMGVGAVNTDYIADISGEDVFGDGQTIATADYFFDEGFGNFAENFAILANSLCPVIIDTEASSACEGQANGTISLQLSPNATGPFSIVVNDEAPFITDSYSIEIADLEAGTYTVTVEGASDCFGPGTEIIEVPITLLPTLEVTPAVICESTETSVNLETLVTSDGIVSFHLTQEDADSGNNPLDTLNVLPSQDVTYFVRSETESGLCYVTATITVSIASLPSCSVNDATIDCYSPEGTVQLVATTDIENALYSWVTFDGNIVSGASTEAPLVNEAGIYTVTITNSETGCSSSCEAVVQTNFELPIVNLELVDNLCLGHDPIQLVGYPQGGQFFGDHVTSEGMFSTSSTGTYTVTYTYVSEENGCAASDTITIDVVDCCEEETAFAYSEMYSTCFIGNANTSSNRWGWSNGPLTIDADYTFDLIAGAGQCVLDNGQLVGTVAINYNTTGDMVVNYSLQDAESPTFYQLETVHVYLGCDQFPESLAPGLMPYQTSAGGNSFVELVVPAQDLAALGCNQFYFIAHAEVVLCNQDVSFLLNTPTIKNPLDSEVFVYPVPFDNYFNVRYKFDFTTEVSFEVMDINGRLLYTFQDKQYSSNNEKSFKINISDQVQQLIFLKVTTTRGTFIKKLIAQ